MANPIVLYAPTWRGHVEETMLYSLPTGERIVSALLQRGATVIFRPHPFSYDFPDDAATIAKIQSLLEADAKQTGRKHLWGPAAERDRGILDCINGSDAMVSDVSSVVSDYLFSGKPFAMIAVPAEPEAFVAEFPVARASYVVRADLADLEPQLDLMLGVDPLAEDRTAIRADYLGDFPAQGYASAFVDAVRQVSGKASGSTADPEEPADGKDDEEESDAGVGRGRRRRPGGLGPELVAVPGSGQPGRARPGRDRIGPGLGWPPRWPTRRSGCPPCWPPPPCWPRSGRCPGQRAQSGSLVPTSDRGGRHPGGAGRRPARLRGAAGGADRGVRRWRVPWSWWAPRSNAGSEPPGPGACWSATCPRR